MTIPANDLSWAANLVHRLGGSEDLLQAARKGDIKQFLHCLAPMVKGASISSPVRKACLVLWPLMDGNVCEPTFGWYFRELADDGWSGNVIHQELKARGVKLPEPPIPGLGGALGHVPQFEEAEDFINRSIATPSEETSMKAFETISYVYGNNITTLTQEQLIGYIKKAEGEKAALDGVKTPSKKIKTMQADLDAAIAKMVEALDAL